jgi:hypothetical protein
MVETVEKVRAFARESLGDVPQQNLGLLLERGTAELRRPWQVILTSLRLPVACLSIWLAGWLAVPYVTYAATLTSLLTLPPSLLRCTPARRRCQRASGPSPGAREEGRRARTSHLKWYLWDPRAHRQHSQLHWARRLGRCWRTDQPRRSWLRSGSSCWRCRVSLGGHKFSRTCSPVWWQAMHQGGSCARTAHGLHSVVTRRSRRSRRLEMPLPLAAGSLHGDQAARGVTWWRAPRCNATPIRGCGGPPRGRHRAQRQRHRAHYGRRLRCAGRGTRRTRRRGRH